jgi:hypothetical protein
MKHVCSAQSDRETRERNESMMIRRRSTILALAAGSLLAQVPSPGPNPPQGASRAPGQRPAMAPTPNTDIHYKLAPDAIPQEGVPVGEIRGPFTLPSEAYPGTQHTYWVYVPAQYDPQVPVSLMIFNDGQAFKNPEGAVRSPS